MAGLVLFVYCGAVVCSRPVYVCFGLDTNLKIYVEGRNVPVSLGWRERY